MKTYDPFEDAQCMSNFCEDNADEFDLWFAEHANHPAKKEHYEQAFCESKGHTFLEYAMQYADDEIDAAGEKAWESNTER